MDPTITISPTIALFSCVAYAGWHKGRDWTGILLGVLLGGAIVAGSVPAEHAGALAGIIIELNKAIAGMLAEFIRMIGQFLSSKGSGVVALRYNIAFLRGR